MVTQTLENCPTLFLKSDRVLYNDRTEIVLKIPEICVAQHGTHDLQTSTPSVAGSAKQKPDDDADMDVRECVLHRGIVGSLRYLSIDR